jgi:tripartite-type tricarboxylate transporter receptor subunit TctC
MLAGIHMTTIPYKGLAPALNDIIGGHVDLIFDTGTTSLPLYKGKKIDIIATGSAERWPSLPNVPTIAESGLPGFRAVTWYGIVAPPGTPAAIAEQISKDIVAVVKSPETAESIRTKLRMDPIGMTNTEASKLFADDTKLWSTVIKEAKISLD